jgi:hypothetical protein
MSNKTTPELLTIGIVAALALWGISSVSAGRMPADVLPVTTNRPSVDQQEVYVSIWKTAVDTQMHFNEMCGKARQFGLTFVAAALGLAVVLMSRGQEFSLEVPVFGGIQLHAIVVVVFASAFALYAVKVLDLNVYHKM